MKFRIIADIKNNCVILHRYKKDVIICYNLGTDMYNIKKYNVNIGYVIKLKKSLNDIFANDLHNIILYYFDFKYVVHNFFK